MKIRSLVLISILLFSLNTLGCGKENVTPAENDSQEEEISQEKTNSEENLQIDNASEEELFSESENENDESWKVLMKEALVKAMKDYWEYERDNVNYDGISEEEYFNKSVFGLGFIDDDDIPEVFVGPCTGGVHGYGSCILYIKEGEVEEYRIDWCDNITYVPRGDIIKIFHGMHIPYQEHIVVWSTGEELGHGEFNDPGWYDGEDHSFNDESIEYRWNDEFVSESEYNAKKEAVFGAESEIQSLGWGGNDFYSYAEILAYLNTSSDVSPEGLNEDVAVGYLNIMINDPDGLRNEFGAESKYGLLYINDDDLPELVVHRTQTANQFMTEDCTVYGFKEGKVQIIPVKRMSGNISFDRVYYEKKDYICTDICYEAIDDWSGGDEYCPVFDHENPNYTKWDYNYPLEYQTGNPEDYDTQVNYTEYLKDGVVITEEEYNSGLNTMGLNNAKIIVDECQGYSEVINILSDYISLDSIEKMKEYENTSALNESEGTILYSVVVSAPDGYVNFRKGPGTDYDIIKPVNNGEVMDVIEEDEKWYKVIYDNQTGYVAKSQMTKYE